jgi:hypothetical protein
MLFSTTQQCLSSCIGKLPNISFKADGYAAAQLRRQAVNMDFFLAKERIGLMRSFRLYWFYVLPFALLPFLAVAIRANFPPTAAPIATGACFVAVGILAMWPVAFKDASNRLWLFACLGWLVSSVLAMLLPATAALGTA